MISIFPGQARLTFRDNPPVNAYGRDGPGTI
jgi:hypothetical protein